jgi:hypothetical protein
MLKMLGQFFSVEIQASEYPAFVEKVFPHVRAVANTTLDPFQRIEVIERAKRPDCTLVQAIAEVTARG